MVKEYENNPNSTAEMAGVKKLKDEEIESVIGGTAIDGGSSGAGIGSGHSGSVGTITINGGK